MLSISTRHSKQVPIMQNGARGDSLIAVCRVGIAASNSIAAATDIPAGTVTGFPSR
jgi:hypothetical protein